MEKFLKLIKSKQFVLYVTIFLITAAMVLKLFNLQIINGAYWNSMATKGYISERIIQAPRGNIYDRNGKLIAYNRTGYDIYIVDNREITYQERNRMYDKFIKLMESNGDELENQLSKYITEDIEFGTLIDDDKDEEEMALRKSWTERIINKIFNMELKENEMEELKTAKDIYEFFKIKMFRVEEEERETDEFTAEEAYKIVALKYTIGMNGSLSRKTPLKLAADISQKTMMEIESRHLEFPGIYTEETYIRQYNYAQTVSHVLGYVRLISEDEYENEYTEELGYTMNDIVGKAGVEKSAESILRGTNGKKVINVDKNGRELNVISKTDAIPGNDIYLSIDIDLQETSLETMKKYIDIVKSEADGIKNFGDCFGGAIVAMDVNTGEVLASVSFPDYDPSIFLAPSSDEEAQKAIAALYSEGSTLSDFNRVTKGLYAPGSVFKPIVAAASVEKNVITEHDHRYCSGEGVYAGQTIKCLGVHNNSALVEALAKSCNVYFCDVGVETKIEVIDQYAKIFGLGEKTGLDMYEEQGYRSNEQTLREQDTDLTHVWTAADTAQTSIGQLYCNFTPLQLARYSAALGTKGTLVNPHYVYKQVSSSGEVKITETITSKIEGVTDNTYNIINEGMKGVLTENNLRQFFDKEKFGFDIAGKTGTPETGVKNEEKSSNGVFICYAPAENPEISISVVLEKGVWGTNAAKVASEILEEYFGINEAEEKKYEVSSTSPDILP